MTNEAMSWDEIYEDETTPAQTPDNTGGDNIDDIVNPSTVDENGDPIIPEGGLQSNLPGDEEDEDTPPADPDDKGDNPDNPDDKGQPVNPDDPSTEDQSGIELYLSQFDIEGGMINFEDGTSKHYDDLDSAKQAEILQQLHSNQAASVEEKYGLVDSEIGLINYLRENKLSVEQMVESMANERVETLLAMRNSQDTDFDKMADDAVYTKFLKESNPGDSTEDIEKKLEGAKKLDNFSNLAGALRTQYKAKQTDEQAIVAADKAKEAQTALEDQRKTVVQAVSPMKDIAGVSLNDNIKNSVLDRVLETDESGDSLFMSEVFGDPEKLFKAAFWYYYGDNIAKQRDDYWKKEKSAAYKRGRTDALGKGATPVTFSSNKKTGQQPVSQKRQTEVSEYAFED